MSAYLAFHYQSHGLGALAKLLPYAIGIAYESKDFISHRQEGVSFKDSKKNFMTDTRRHAIGAEFGRAFCQ